MRIGYNRPLYLLPFDHRHSYESGMFGKFHLAGPENNPAGNGTPGVLGWDYFYGWIGGLPASIDTTAGGIAPTGTYSCGFVPSAAHGGADTGAFAETTAHPRPCSPATCPEKACARVKLCGA